MDVEVDLRGLSNPAPVDVGLVREDDRRGHGAGRFSALLLVVADGPHDQRKVRHRHPVLQHVVGEERTDLAVRIPGHHVADVVQIAGHAPQRGQPIPHVEPAQDVEGDAGREVGVPEPVLGEPEPLHHVVRVGDEQGDLAVLLDLLEAQQIA